ncbi:putative ATP-dependent hsl protease ATP-binding subunit hslU [Toxoplasma gondii GT1]|uniref:Putative ATP-dependent hsl protease ATP-binding subunit hslU n=2 Tax=Toxoplasma gondii TaxID=5811 RepID=S7UQ62_TOXGG|nr:putative ATP-dependent hsl protease ATP-binding subunit hslU [Toxoplasma gondii GT1]KAF4644460.1 putative ATP-dependent hsl protease ATP-binding subunit hslU [Toxoplasma gondii]
MRCLLSGRTRPSVGPLRPSSSITGRHSPSCTVSLSKPYADSSGQALLLLPVRGERKIWSSTLCVGSACCPLPSVSSLSPLRDVSLLDRKCVSLGCLRVSRSVSTVSLALASRGPQGATGVSDEVGLRRTTRLSCSVSSRSPLLTCPPMLFSFRSYIHHPSRGSPYRRGDREGKRVSHMRGGSVQVYLHPASCGDTFSAHSRRGVFCVHQDAVIAGKERAWTSSQRLAGAASSSLFPTCISQKRQLCTTTSQPPHTGPQSPPSHPSSSLFPSSLSSPPLSSPLSSLSSLSPCEGDSGSGFCESAGKGSASCVVVEQQGLSSQGGLFIFAVEVPETQSRSVTQGVGITHLLSQARSPQTSSALLFSYSYFSPALCHSFQSALPTRNTDLPSASIHRGCFSCFPPSSSSCFSSYCSSASCIPSSYSARRVCCSLFPVLSVSSSSPSFTASSSRFFASSAPTCSGASPPSLPSSRPTSLTPQTTSERRDKSHSLCPQAMVEYLNRFIVGQVEAKRAVAVALRQRWRRRHIEDERLREDITPKNILLIGPTGVGKTEVARRLAKRLDAPFIKVEATKFTEVGFHGRDVDQIIKDLVEVAVKTQRTKLQEVMRPAAEHRAERKILEALLGKMPAEEHQHWLRHLRCGALDARRVHVDFPQRPSGGAASGGSFTEEGNRDAIVADLESIIRDIDRPRPAFFTTRRSGRGSEGRNLTVKEARKKLMQAELDSMITKDLVVQKALEAVEQEGIVFIDEIDKICSKGGRNGYNPDASDEGVQRDLLPLIEGTTVSTRYGDVKTDYILFIASGAFHCVRPSDLLAELQGRLPIRVTLKSLTENDLRDILTKTQNNLLAQNTALLRTENVELHFTEEAVNEIARVACEVNASVENIGARRLHTIIEKIMEDINFAAPSMAPGTRVEVDLERVRSSVSSLLTKTDYTRFVL